MKQVVEYFMLGIPVYQNIEKLEVGVDRYKKCLNSTNVHL